jgi:hypothetical protein
VRTARERAFVGREAEIALLDAAVRGDPGSPSICFLHGPGGIGKSALLRRVADSARGAGCPVVELDGRFLEPSTRAFEDAAAEVVDRARAVLLVDTFERCAWSQSWLRDRFLPGLRDDVLVVLAGREPPELEWSLDPGWSDVLCVLALEPLDRAHAAAVLTAGGVDASRRDAVIRFAGGNPLALSLAVAVAAAHEGDDGLWQPSAQVLDTLLARLVGDVPSGAHRRALEATAQTFRMTEELLRVAVAGDDAAELFDWLRGLPFVESSAHGLHPHDAARAALVADLRWRDAGTFDAVRTRLSAHLLQQIRAVSEDEALSAMCELWYLYRDSPGVAAASAWEAHGRVQHEPLGPDDLATAVAAARADGPETAELVRYWFDRRPGAFGLYRSVRTGRPVAFCARLQLTAPVEQRDAERDPVVAAVREYCGDHVERGRQVAMTRFLVTLDDGEHAAHVASAVRWRSLASICRSPALAHGFVVRRETDPVEAWLGSTMTPSTRGPSSTGEPTGCSRATGAPRRSSSGSAQPWRVTGRCRRRCRRDRPRTRSPASRSTMRSVRRCSCGASRTACGAAGWRRPRWSPSTPTRWTPRSARSSGRPSRTCASTLAVCAATTPSRRPTSPALRPSRPRHAGWGCRSAPTAATSSRVCRTSATGCGRTRRTARSHAGHVPGG